MYTLSCIGEKKAKLQELSNNISDRSEAKGTGILSDLLLVNGEARQLVANPQYTILLKGDSTSEAVRFFCKVYAYLCNFYRSIEGGVS